ncbi:MAG: hypothetical protein K6G70_04755 [Bacteroidaceae bacterium]|nr:hypothetical protein [Bacteroidaceae bacterium]
MLEPLIPASEVKDILLGDILVLGVTDTVTLSPFQPATCKWRYFAPDGTVILTAPDFELVPALIAEKSVPVELNLTFAVLALVPPVVESVTLLVYVADSSLCAHALLPTMSAQSRSMVLSNRFFISFDFIVRF